jgi:hypothetical protein
MGPDLSISSYKVENIYILVYCYQLPLHLSNRAKQNESAPIGETGVKWDTGSKGTVGGKIVDVKKT